MTLTHQASLVEGSSLPPIVLLHGFTSSAAADYVSTGWLDAVNAAGRSALAIDLPAHGNNLPLDAAQASTSQVVASILATIDEVFPEGPVDVIGYSLGARLAWDLPRTSPRVRRIVLGGLSPMDPFGMIDTAELAAVLGGAAPGNPFTGMLAGMISAPGNDTASLAALIGGLGSEAFNPAAGAPEVPALLVAGSDDQMMQGIESIVEVLPEASLTHVPGDHRGALDSPEFRAAAIEFLA